VVSALAREDYEDLIAAGLKPTLDDFDRLNQIALRLTDGAETTARNFPRIGWAGDIPFFQPTCAAFAWYLQFVDRTNLDVATKDACWFFALANGRVYGAFDDLDDAKAISNAVNDWLASLPVTRDEIARACRFAATGFDDAVAGKTLTEAAADAQKTDEMKREESLGGLHECVTVAASLTGIAPDKLMQETPDRLKAMIDEVRELHDKGDRDGGKGKRQKDYDMTLREIRKRLMAEKEAQNAEANDGK